MLNNTTNPPSTQESTSIVSWQGLSVSLEDNLVTFKGASVSLRSTGLELLYVLTQHAPKVASLEALANGVWGQHWPDCWRFIISNRLGPVRKLLKRFRMCVISYYLVGYRLAFDDDSVLSEPTARSPTRYPIELQARIRLLSIDGMSAAKIALAIGHSIGSVTGAMSRFGLFARPRQRKQE